MSTAILQSCQLLPFKPRGCLFTSRLQLNPWFNEVFFIAAGPYHINGCPLRRINQAYVIATKTKLDISRVQLPERLNDAYFKRQKSKKPKHAEGDIFDSKKEVRTVIFLERYRNPTCTVIPLATPQPAVQYVP